MLPIRTLGLRLRMGRAASGLAVLTIAFGASSASAQLAAWRVQLLSRASHPNERGAYAAVWGYTAPDGTELAMIGTNGGTDFYDVTDPRNPLRVAQIPGPHSAWREMQTWSTYAYIVTEGTGLESRGVQIVDLSNPHTPTYVGDFDSTFVTAHSIHVRDGYAYINGSNNGWRILDLSDPVHPRDVGHWNVRYVHDCFVRGNTAYLANINSGGFTVLDITDRSHPNEISFTSYLGASTHNCWLTDDSRYLLTTDEVMGGHLRIWDLQFPGSPTPVTEWTAYTGASIHNVVVKGDSAYIAYYTEGLQVLDIGNPRSPQLVGYYDTYPGGRGLFDGNWGVYPFARNGSIYLSDISAGLIVVKMTDAGEPMLDFTLTPPPPQTTLPGQDQCFFFFDIYNPSASPKTFDLTGTNSADWDMTLPSEITIPGTGAEAVFVRVFVPAGLTMPTRVDVELCVRSRSSGAAQCVSTRVSVPVTLQAFTAAADPNGVDLHWRLQRDPGDAGELLVSRARSESRRDAGELAFEIRARLDLTSDGWRDSDVDPGTTYVYRLALATAAGTHLLGEREVAVGAPVRSRLLGNVPNPFNPATTIRFELARPGDVAIGIFDARGKRVRMLQVADRSAGMHAVAWDGRDASGRTQPSGIYLYEVRSMGWSAHGRMTLAK